MTWKRSGPKETNQQKQHSAPPPISLSKEKKKGKGKKEKEDSRDLLIWDGLSLSSCLCRQGDNWQLSLSLGARDWSHDQDGCWSSSRQRTSRVFTPLPHVTEHCNTHAHRMHVGSLVSA